MATAREELHRVIDKLQDKDVESLLHLLKRIAPSYEVDEEELTPEEIKAIEEGEAQIARGEYVTLDDLKKEFGL